MASSYNEDSIQKLSPLEFTRKRPDVYTGSTADPTQLAIEIISNSVDEHLIGNCDHIAVTIHRCSLGDVVTIYDNGQGILPNVVKDDGRTVLEMVYGDINTSGKYDKSDDAVYQVSTGAFGIGSALVNFLSHWLTAVTMRDGSTERVEFEEGRFSSRAVGDCVPDAHGMEVSFSPSGEFFDSPHIDCQELLRRLELVSYFCPGLRISFSLVEDGDETLCENLSHPKGVREYLVDVVSDSALVDDMLWFRAEEGRQSLDMGLAFSKGSSPEIVSFCNYAPIESGTPVTAIKSTITRVFNKWGHERRILKERENLPGNSLQEGMVLAFNLSSPSIRYDSQTKVRVTSTDDNAFLSNVVSAHLEKWLDLHPNAGKAILDKALVAHRASEAARKAREAVKKKAEGKDKVFKLPTKLTDCWGKDRSKCELFICEGVSAASGLVAARDSEFQAIYGVRGKVLNVLKVKPAKILANQEVNNLIQALGLECDPKTAKLTYDPSRLRYGKIFATADADPDGVAINSLIYNMLWFLCPELIINGHVWQSVPALYRITTKKNEYVYLSGDPELREWKKKHSKRIKSIGRNKGIGETDTDEISETLLDPSTRNCRQVTVSDVQATDTMFQDLYGKDVAPRVRYLQEHGEEANVG